MSTLSDSLGALARGGAQLLRIPTAFLLGWAGLVLLLLCLEVWSLLAGGGPGGIGAVLLVGYVVLLALPVVVLAVRRQRWLRLTHDLPTTQGGTVIVTGTTDLVTVDALSDRVEDQIVGIDGEDDVRAVMDAFTEAQLPEATRRGAGARMTRAFGVGRLAVIGRVLGRMERAQRALLTAAGGPTRAPYLKDDLRVTVVAFAGTLATIVLGGVTVLVLAAVLLAR